MEHTNDMESLSHFLTDSLSLHSVSNVQTRNMFPLSESPYLKICHEDPLEVLGEKSFGKPRKVLRDVVGTPIQEFFRDANVFITGGTGFIGKLLTEKLVRSVPHIGHIYILIRPKRGKGVQERFYGLLEDEAFFRMKTEVPDYLKLISAVEGDIGEPNLGLSESDRHLLLDKVNVVFHSAADVRFIEPLRAAIKSNVYGSRRVLELAKGMKNIKSYVHVSTAYSQCVRGFIPEAVPKMSLSYKEILQEIESMTDEELRMDLPRLLQGWPNTYTFSKALSEEMIQNEADELPVSIFRPSVVIYTYHEPVRGYTDNLNGPIGIILGVITGVLHCFPAPSDLALDMIPVDYVVNSMIAVAYSRTAQTRANDLLPVYNCTMSPHNTNGLSWKCLMSYGNRIKQCWPIKQAIWSDSMMMTESVLLDRIAHFFLHQIPGMVLDKIAIIAGQKPVLTKVYDRLQTLKGPLNFFASHVWEFQTDNILRLQNSLSEEDKILFNFDVRDINVTEWIHVGKLGLRYYYLRESMDTISSAEFKNNLLLWLHRGVKLVAGLAMLKVCVIVAHILPI